MLDRRTARYLSLASLLSKTRINHVRQSSQGSPPSKRGTSNARNMAIDASFHLTVAPALRRVRYSAHDPSRRTDLRRERRPEVSCYSLSGAGGGRQAVKPRTGLRAQSATLSLIRDEIEEHPKLPSRCGSLGRDDLLCIAPSANFQRELSVILLKSFVLVD